MLRRSRTRPAAITAAVATAGAVALTGAAAAALAGCGALPHQRTGAISVVAAENVWGSIAAQLAGTRAQVRSVIVDPAQDPHAYEPTAADARSLAGARLAVVNGISYDAWASRLLAADGDTGSRVLDIGRLLGMGPGSNPHRWYDPSQVDTVAGALAARLTQIDPAGAGYYRRRLRSFEAAALGRYHTLIARIAARYGGTPVGASESIVAPLAAALGLRLLTPATFMNATSEGTDVSAQDALTTERQIAARQIRVWIVNAQNETPQVQQLTALARAHGIPVVSVTETVTPAEVSFEAWQSSQLAALEQALARARSR